MKVFVENREINVRELTVGEIRAWLNDIVANANKQQPDLLGEVLFEEMSLREISMLTDLSSMQVESLHPTALYQLVHAITTVNPHWHNCRKRIMAVGEKLRANAAHSVVPA